MGDDLNFAQKFTRTAADGLALLVEMEDPRAPNQACVVIDMMTSVQRGAKRLRARHIYSGAQGVLSALHHENDATLESRISSLGCLVTEYARGLDELLQTPEAAPQKSPLDKWEQARETLNTLLPVASAEDADMLSRLMRAPVSLETVQPDLEPASPDTNILPFELNETVETTENLGSDDADGLEVNDIDAALAEALRMAVPKPPLSAAGAAAVPATEPTSTIETGPIIALDIVMRDVVADALSVARTVGRTISLSYDMEDRTVTELRAVDLRKRLGQALSQIIRQSLKDGRVGHIDINLAGQQLHIMAGTTAVRVAIDPDAQPKPKPLITAETEHGLRQQLDALMDPMSLHETAS